MMHTSTSSTISALDSVEKAGQALIKHMSALLNTDNISYIKGLGSINDH